MVEGTFDMVRLEASRAALAQQLKAALQDQQNSSADPPQVRFFGDRHQAHFKCFSIGYSEYTTEVKALHTMLQTAFCHLNFSGWLSLACIVLA